MIKFWLFRLFGGLLLLFSAAAIYTILSSYSWSHPVMIATQAVLAWFSMMVGLTLWRRAKPRANLPWGIKPYDWE